MVTREFAEEVRSKVQAMTGDGCEVAIADVLKNNGLRLTGLTIREEGSDVSPTIYIEELGTGDADEAAETVMERYRLGASRAAEELPDRLRESIMDRDRILNEVMPRVINYAWNEEYLKGVPHRRFMDLAVIYCIPVGENATLKLTNSHARMLDLAEEELHGAAMANAERHGYEVESMAEFLKHVKAAGIPDDAFGDPMRDLMIISNRERSFGAYSFFAREAMKEIADRIGTNLYIIPSSVHELLAIGDLPEARKETIAEMVKAVNAENVMPEERLSDSVYYFDRETCEVSIAVAG